MLWPSFPPQLQCLLIEQGALSDASWSSLSRCQHLTQLDCTIFQRPGFPAEALPRLQVLRIEVYRPELVSWAATLVSKSERSSLRLYADPAPLAEPRFHGLQLDKLSVEHPHPCTDLLWRNLSVRHLVVGAFEGRRLSSDLLPSDLERCEITVSARARILVVDLIVVEPRLQEFSVQVFLNCRLELHGSFQPTVKAGHECMQAVQWLGPARCSGLYIYTRCRVWCPE